MIWHNNTIMPTIPKSSGASRGEVTGHSLKSEIASLVSKGGKPDPEPSLNNPRLKAWDLSA